MLTFDTLAKKIVEREKAFGKKMCDSSSKIVCIAKKGKHSSHDSYQGKMSNRG